MFRSDESFRLEPLKTEIRGTRAAQPRRRTRSISRACPRRTATRAPARRARLLARPRRTSARFVRARGRGARGERARPLALPPRPLARSPRVATRWHPRCQRARSGRRHVRPDLALGSPRPSARARDPRARPGSPPPTPSRWRRPSPPRTRRSRRSRSRPPRAPPPPRGRPGAVVFAPRAASPTTARRARMPFARGAQDHRDPAAALSPRSSPPPAPRSAPPR